MVKCNASESYLELLNELEKSNVGLNVGLNDIQNKIISIIAENNIITQLELAKKPNVEKRTVERNIAILRENKIIQRIGSKKNGYLQILDN